MDKKIIEMAKKVKTYVEKNAKIPLTLGNYNYGQVAYNLAKGIMNESSNFENKKINNSPNPQGDNVNLTILQKDYVTLAKGLVSFVNENGRIRNYLSYNNKKIRPKVYLYSFAKVIVFYSENGRLPDSCKFESTVFNTNKSTIHVSKKYGHATKTGCDNMGQNTSYYCACHSLQEVIRNLYGIVISQKILAGVMGTTSSGTSHQGIATAVAWFNKKYNKNLVMTEHYFGDFGVNGLKKIIASENHDFITHLAYQGKFGHYEVVNSIAGEVWNIQNSLGNKCSSGCYCGHRESRNFSTEKAWINAKSGVKSILVFTKK